MYYNLTYMFKYSSFRNFVKKFIIGVVLITVSLLFLISLYSHSYSDPGFQTFNTEQSEFNIVKLSWFVWSIFIELHYNHNRTPVIFFWFLLIT